VALKFLNGDRVKSLGTPPTGSVGDVRFRTRVILYVAAALALAVALGAASMCVDVALRPSGYSSATLGEHYLWGEAADRSCEVDTRPLAPPAVIASSALPAFTFWLVIALAAGITGLVLVLLTSLAGRTSS